jgi:predicted Zn-dependent protease
VAKLEETRWRDPQPLDDVPSADDVAQVGFEKGLAHPLDELGPSVAMLPSAAEAAVAFAEVSSFLRYFTRTEGRDALPRLVRRLKEASAADDVNAAIQEVSGSNLAAWNTRWRAYLASRQGTLPADLVPGAASRGISEVVRNARLGELYAERGHAAAAVVRIGRAQALAPSDGMLRALLAAALQSDGRLDTAAPLVERARELHSPYGRWWSLHGRLFPDPEQDAERSFALGVSLDPCTPEVACEERLAPELPSDPFRRALCAADRAGAAEN